MRLSKNKISTAKFKKLSNEEQEKILNDIKHLYIDKNLSRDEVLQEYEIGLEFFKWLMRTYGVKKDKKLVQENIDKTFIEKYGRTGFANQEKIKETMLERYGVDNISKSKEAIARRNKTNQERYGGNAPACSKEVQQKMQSTCLKKYGVTNIRKLPIFKKRIVEAMSKTIQEKYGVPFYCMTDDCINAQGHIISKINLRFAKKLDDLNISYDLEYRLENHSYDFRVGNNLIEINPTYTHNSTFGPYIKNGIGKPKEETYHLEKTKLANKYGFRCIHVFNNDDWDKIISLLVTKTKIYARNCELKEVSIKDTHEFLCNYHLQNTCRMQTVRLGLYFEGQLVQIMTFGKPRYNKKYEWELLRLCSHKDYIIIGGAERLFSRFKTVYKPQSIISYCDNSKFSGTVYERLGMKLNTITSPAGNWYDIDDNYLLDSLLRQRGFDQIFKTDFGKNISNYDLMIQTGWVQVFNCGQKVYTFRKED